MLYKRTGGFVVETCKNKIYKAYVYLRLSKEDIEASESNSIINQRLLVEEFVKSQNDIEVVAEQFDDGYSGTNYDRPGFQKMLSDLKDGVADCVIVKDLSRLGRDYIETGNFLQYVFPAMNIRFIAINDYVDTVSSSQLDKNLLIPIKNLMNDTYCRDLSIKLRKQFKVQRSNGEFMGSFVFFGYKRDENNKHQLVPDEVAAQVVKEIFNLSLKGYSNKKIAELLNEKGVPSPKTYKNNMGINLKSGFAEKEESLWGHKTIERILSNKIYLGILEQGKRQTPNYKVKKIMEKSQSEWDVVHDAHEAIIEKAIFDAVERMKKRDIRMSPQKGHAPLFTGLLFCADCQKPVYIRTVKRGNKKFFYYVCSTYKNGKGCSSHSIKVEDLENLILRAINQQIITVVRLKQLSEDIGYVKIQKSKKQKLDYLINSKEAEISSKKAYQMKLSDFLLDEIISNDEYVTLRDRYVEQIAELEKQKSESLAEKQEVESGLSQNHTWMDTFTQYEKITELTREIVVILIDKVLIHDDGKIEIIFNFKNEYLELAEITQKILKVVG